MHIRYRHDPAIVERWAGQCARYRRKTRRLWLAAPIVVVPPVLMCVVGTDLFYPAFALGAIGLLAIGGVLGRHGALLLCPQCGRRPLPVRRMGAILDVEFCRRCATWLKTPLHFRGGDGAPDAAATTRERIR